MEAYTHLLLSLVSSSIRAVPAALNMLVRQLRPVERKAPAAAGGVASTSDYVVDKVTSELVAERALAVLRQLLHVVPTATSTLVDTVLRQFPNRRMHSLVLRGYVSSALRLGEFCVPLRVAILKQVRCVFFLFFFVFVLFSAFYFAFLFSLFFFRLCISFFVAFPVFV